MMRRILTLTLLILLVGGAVGGLLKSQKPAIAAGVVIDYPATVLLVDDGDTVKVHVAGFPAPFDPIGVRIMGIDTPEHVMPPAKSACEVQLGLAAKAYGQTLLKAGDQVVVHYRTGTHDKYGRLLGSITLPDGSDWAGRMIAAHMAHAYSGGTKTAWCGPDGKPLSF